MILASQSPRRIELMTEAGYDVEVRPADIDESRLDGESPTHLVERLACAKAAAVADGALDDEFVVAADTIVYLEDKIFGKPQDTDDAHAMLAELSGNTHHVATGVCVRRGSRCESFVDITEVRFYELTKQDIDTYCATDEPYDKAGAYGIQGIGGRMLVKSIHGDFYNVVGLPIARVKRLISSME